MDSENNDTAKPAELSGRQRKKLYNKLREQMEFYFSDSNLAKDKFLYNLIQQNSDGYVELEIFKSFNKIKALSEDVNLIAASLSRSDMLELSEDKSKVRRKTTIEMSKDFDACTLYVEGLPSHADHKWIKDIFEQFGTVDYINIPRYKISHKIKGFAFIEYSSPESVIKACQFYENSSKTENVESEDENVGSKEEKIRKSEDSENRKTKQIKLDVSKRVEEDKLDQSKDCDLEKQQNPPVQKVKRKLEFSDSDNTNYCKKQKTDSSHQELENSYHESDSENNLSKESMEQNTSAALDSSCNNEDLKEDSSKSKKKRKHSRKHRVRHERPSLRVMSKTQWKKLRNKYLELQRTTMSFLKKQVLLESEEIRLLENNTKPENSRKKELKFIPGVIIKLHLPKTIENPSDIKEQIKSIIVPAYIDAITGYNVTFIRCHTSEEANSIIQDGKLNHIGTAEFLTGSDEEEYWKKIMSDRESRLNMPRKRRGRDKLIAKASKLLEHRNKHIYYE